MEPRSYRLRCYLVIRPSGTVVAVCLKPNLVVEGRSETDARQRLHELIEAYAIDAAADGHLDLLMARRAPFRFYREFWIGRLKNLLTGTFHTFTETHTPQHA
ncbi:MAG: hypothetical protein IH939_12555 [Acidobacteria bacterium]|nr:hypothetical protein [Acidobacteriota bacterium]